MENPIVEDRSLHGEQAYLYGLKARALRHHCLGHGTFTVDMTALGRLRPLYSRRVTPITYVPIYVKALALAMKLHPDCNAILFRKPFGLRVVRFERIDVNLPITRQIDGRQVTFIGTIANPAVKTLGEIQGELTALQRCPPRESFAIRRFLQFDRLPLWLSNLIHARMTWSPSFYAGSVGTCGLTFLPGDWYDSFLPIAPTSIVMGIGSLRREVIVDGDEISVQRRLHCALMGDNFVISGLMGAALAKDFKRLLESGAFILDEMGHRAG